MQHLELIISIIFLIIVFSFFSLAPWIPTRKKDLSRINKVINLKNGEHFLEMGCGTGLCSLYIAKNNPNSKIVGIELSPFFYLISKIRVFFSGLINIKIKYGNALKQDLNSYDAIYVFGLPDTITTKIFPKINKIKNKDFRLVSYCFKMTNNYFKETKYKPKDEYAIYKYNIDKKGD